MHAKHSVIAFSSIQSVPVFKAGVPKCRKLQRFKPKMHLTDLVDASTGLVQVELSPGQLSELVQLHGTRGRGCGCKPTGFLNKNRFRKTNKQWVLLEHWGLDDHLERSGIGKKKKPNLNVRRIEAALSEAGISFMRILGFLHGTSNFERTSIFDFSQL